MGVDITFQKPIKLSEVESKTDIKVSYNKSFIALSKGEFGLRVSRLFVQDSDEIYISELDYRYKGMEIVYDLILAFQTKVMTDEDEESLIRGLETDVDKLFTERTLQYGFNIDNGVISFNE